MLEMRAFLPSPQVLSQAWTWGLKGAQSTCLSQVDRWELRILPILVHWLPTSTDPDARQPAPSCAL